MECLHTILLGPVKYFLTDLMDRLSPQQKRTIIAKINSFHYSGMESKISGTAICRYSVSCFGGYRYHNLVVDYRYHHSLVGRDFKVWAQIGLHFVWDFLTSDEKRMWLSLAKVST